MNKVNSETIKPLLHPDDDIMMSLYFPTHRAPTSVHVQEDKIRFKNLIRTGSDMLEKRGVDGDIIRKIGNRLEDIYNNDDFWQYTTEGMAIFSSLTDTQYYHLPIECEEYAAAGDRYDVTPLLAVLSYDQPYYLLALAVHGPVLYKGDMYGLEQVDIDLPKSPEDALNIDEMFSNSRTVRAGGGYGPGSPSSGSHGQGDSRQAGQEERLEFFRIIDDKILSSDQIDSNLPLLIAGSEGDITDYKESSRHKHLVQSYLAGNYTESSGANPQEIHTLSWQLIEEELVRGRQAEELERFNELRGADRSATDLDAIKTAVKEGRVDTLLLGMLTVTRDIVKDSNDAAMKLVFPEDYKQDGIDLCGRNAFDQGGKIVALLQGDMPENARQAAIYRY